MRSRGRGARAAPIKNAGVHVRPENVPPLPENAWRLRQFWRTRRGAVAEDDFHVAARSLSLCRHVAAQVQDARPAAAA
ncbi:hypothetical protein EON67_05560 [archaeon]|nr:MAG: hypothetical protein EON67_05560 [archaeon]